MRLIRHSTLRSTLFILVLSLPTMVAAQTAELVSFNVGETDTGNGFSGSPRVSADGRFVVFQSFASNLVPTDTNGGSNTGDIFVRDRILGITILVSVNSVGTDSGDGASSNPVISADGRFVAFQSDASDLVAADTNGATDIFVRDLMAGTTILVSVNSDGTGSGNAASTNPRISADGSLVVFESLADDLVATDNNGASDVFLRDLGAGTTSLISVNTMGDSGNGASHNPQISADGSVVAFESDASNLVATTDTNGGTPATDVFARDLGAGTTALLSINMAGTNSGNGPSLLGRFSISQNGNLVVFASEADDLVANDTTAATRDIFLRNLGAGTTALVSVNTTGDGGSGSSLNPVISADGGTVAFESFATDLVATDTTGFKDVFARNLAGGSTTLLSINSGGTDSANGASSNPVISDDGRFVAFVSDASDLVGTDTNTSQDVFLRDRMGAATFLASVNSGGTDSGSGTSSAAALAGDGSLLAFSSDAADLVATDTNSGNMFFDVFVFAAIAPTTGSLSGFVYVDANNDGVRDPNEIGLSGVTVTLSGSAAAITTTATDGSYSFTGLAPGTYTITETQPTDFVDGTDAVGSVGGTLGNDVLSNIVLAAGVIGTDYNFGEQGGVLAGNVYVDADNDGVFDVGEVGLSGVTVTLTGTDSMNNPVNVMTTTVSGGSYSFNNLLAGTYTITETQPAGIADGTDSVGTAGGTLATDAISNIVLSGGGVGQNYDFGEIAGSLVGRVYLDNNGNGVRDSGETGISGVTVTLTGNDVNGAVNRMTATNTNGDFFFTVLRQGTFTLTETTQPAGFNDGMETACTVPMGSTGGTVGNDVISNISLAAGAAGTNCNFGELATVSVSIDDVSVAEGDAGTTNATFTVTLSATFALDVTANFATSNGTATAPSDYTATSGMVTIPAGMTTATIQVPVMGDITPEGDETFFVNLSNVVNAAVTDSQGQATIVDNEPPAAMLSGNVYVDANHNGAFDMGEVGLSGVTVTLTGTDNLNNPVNLVTMTAGGAYAFNNLLAGTYTITETQPAGIADGSETACTVPAGSTGGTAGNDVISGISIASGASGTNCNFGEIAGSLTGRVYLDSNSNGVRDAGETGISGVTVTLTGNDVNGPVNRVSMTNATGDFFFTVLRQGTYTLTETGPADFLDGTDTPCTVPAGSTGGTAGNDAISNISLAAGATGTCNFGELATVSLSINDVTVAEGNAGGTNATFTVTLSGPFTRDVTANFATSNGTATASTPAAAGDDYTATTGMVTIPATSTTATIQVPVLGDTAQETDETFAVNLTNVTNAAVTDSQGQGTITDDDPPFRVSASPATTSSTPVSIIAGQSATFTVTVTAMPPPFNEAVSLSCSGLPELASCAFTPPSVTPGATFATSTLVISTVAPQNALTLPFMRQQRAPLYALGLSAFGVLGIVLAGWERKRSPRKRKLRAYLWGSLLLTMLALAGCGSTSVGTRTGGPFTVVVTASSSQGLRTTTIFLTVR